MGKFGIATNPNVAPTGYSLAHNDVWVNGVKREVIADIGDLDNRLATIGTAGVIAVESEVILEAQEDASVTQQ